jgi:hypothetical protein
LVYARKALLGVTAAFVSLLCIASSASAASSPFGCRASAARVGLLGSTLLEPAVANNAENPCVNDSKLLSEVNVPATGSPLLTAGPAAVYTAASDATGAAALAQVDGVTIPTPSGALVIAGPIYALAEYSCVNGSVSSNAMSTLDLLYIGGTPVTLTPGQNMTIQLGGGSYVSVNEQISTANSLTERVLDVHLAGLADIVVGEATVNQPASNPCTGPGGGGGGPITICPPGTTYNPGLQACVITLPGGGVIVINPPFGGESGGTVIPLGEARQLYNSRCLYGPGPNYAIVGTNGPDHINGTRRAERILGLGGNDVINGGGGNDCIDGGRGNDRLTDKDGNVRAYGGPGNDRIFLRNGNDHVYAGTGTNRLSVGRGNDWVYGGPGISTIYMDHGPKHVFLGARGGRAFAPGARDALHCASARDHVSVNIFALGFAKRHGCVAPRPLTPAQL